MKKLIIKGVFGILVMYAILIIGLDVTDDEKMHSELVDTVQISSETHTESTINVQIPEETTKKVVKTSKKVAKASKSEMQSYAKSLFGNYGWNDSDFEALINLWNRESGWRVNASNGSCYGIPQSCPGSKIASYGNDWKTNYKTQIKWGLNYINKRYGSPTSAWNHFKSKGWY